MFYCHAATANPVLTTLVWDLQNCQLDDVYGFIQSQSACFRLLYQLPLYMQACEVSLVCLQDLNDNIAKLQSDFDDVNRKLKASEKLDKEYKHTQKQLMDMLARLHLST